MQTNEIPHFDQSVNTTGCCPKFNPDGWGRQELHFEDMPFVVARTRSALHIPLNMGSVFTRVQNHIDAAHADRPEGFLVLSHDPSAWVGEHLFAVTGDVAGEEMTKLSGDFITRVFEGPYRDAEIWLDEMKSLVRANGSEPGRIFFFYTTCPKCAKAYGQNYIIGIAEI